MGASQALAAAPPRYGNVVIVAKSGGDFTDLRLAMDSILNASPSNPVLIKVMPGTYDLGADYFYAKDYVDVEGSGQGNTIITGSTTGAFYYPGTGTTLRNVTLDNNYTGNWTECLRLKSNTKLDNVSITRNITGATTSTFSGIVLQNADTSNVSISNVDIKIHDVNATAQNAGIALYGGLDNIDISNVTIDMSGGSWVHGIQVYVTFYGKLDIRNSRIDVRNGAQETIAVKSQSGATRVRSSRLAASGSSGTVIGMLNAPNGSTETIDNRVIDSEVRATGSSSWMYGITASLWTVPSNLNINNTLIEGGTYFSSPRQPKMINSFDQSYNLFPNQ
jgi:hypothetical protein